MTKDEVLKLAQKAMENSNSTSYEMLHALTAIKEALAQPAQEPVAWIVEFENGEQELHFDEQSVGETITPLYTVPQQRPWVGLTEAEMQDAHSSAGKNCPRGGDSVKWFADAIEAKLKEKNI